MTEIHRKSLALFRNNYYSFLNSAEFYRILQLYEWER